MTKHTPTLRDARRIAIVGSSREDNTVMTNHKYDANREASAMIVYHTTTIGAARKIVADKALRPWNEVKTTDDYNTIDPGEVFVSEFPYYDNDNIICGHFDGDIRDSVTVVLRLEINSDDIEAHVKGYIHPLGCGMVFYASNAIPVEVISIHRYTEERSIESFCIDSNGVYHDDEIFTYNSGASNFVMGLIRDWRNKNGLVNDSWEEILKKVKYSKVLTEKDCDELTEFSWETGVPIGPCAWDFMPEYMKEGYYDQT